MAINGGRFSALSILALVIIPALWSVPVKGNSNCGFCLHNASCLSGRSDYPQTKDDCRCQRCSTDCGDEPLFTSGCNTTQAQYLSRNPSLAALRQLQTRGGNQGPTPSQTNQQDGDGVALVERTSSSSPRAGAGGGAPIVAAASSGGASGGADVQPPANPPANVSANAAAPAQQPAPPAAAPPSGAQPPAGSSNPQAAAPPPPGGSPDADAPAQQAAGSAASGTQAQQIQVPPAAPIAANTGGSAQGAAAASGGAASSPPAAPAAQTAAAAPAQNPSEAQTPTRASEFDSAGFMEMCQTGCKGVNPRFPLYNNDRTVSVESMNCNAMQNADQKANCESTCHDRCSRLTGYRRDNYTNNRSRVDYSKTDDEGCGDDRLIFAAEAFANDSSINEGGSLNRNDFMNCLNKIRLGTDNGQAFCQTVRARVESNKALHSCAHQKTTNTLLSTTSEALQMGLQATSTFAGQRATLATASTAQAAANGDTTADTQKSALTNAANALTATAGTQVGVGAAQAAFGISLLSMAKTHNDVASRLQRAGADSSGQVNVGADDNGAIIRRDAQALVGLAGSAGAGSKAQAEEASSRGQDYTARALERRRAIAQESTAQGLALLMKGAANAAQSGVYFDQANQLRNQAASIQSAATATPNALPSSSANNNGAGDTVPNSFVAQNGGSTTPIDAQALASPSPAPITPGVDLGPPGSGGGAPTSGLRDNPAGGAGTVNGLANGNQPGGGGGGGLPGVGGGDSGGASEGGGAAGDHLAGGGQASNQFQSIGGGGAGYANAGSRGSAKNETGMDLNSLLAQFLPKKEEKAEGGPSSIADFGSGRGRGPASAEQDDGSILGPNSNLFLRVSNTALGKYRRGDLR